MSAPPAVEPGTTGARPDQHGAAPEAPELDGADPDATDSTTNDGDRAGAPTTMRVHEDRLLSPSPRIDMTPSEAVHLSQEGRRPHR